ncbi:hypothetical protein HSRCO_0282 [Halanaeroarchaeum sp. HSR-CO]|uniref:hypothetical protein n=1 Tax=Halanaeroarchaeum sp. HSR-CO TaxID=2866382 RepID=UPI00217D0F4A|nr:hypothetical protein [Halanaeroarchaeum sp. HSR-CO]UWG46581.1 hypothetical protein HSRCO_0282 [Halanaeroarchaeum sp. HSR-CO]
MPELQPQFETLLDTEEWMQILAVFAAFMAGTVARNVIEPNSPYDLPDEVYGLLVMLGASYSPAYTREIQIGGGLYTADKFAERVGVKSTVRNFGGD